MISAKKTVVTMILLIALFVQSFSTGIYSVSAIEPEYKGELRWDFLDGTENFAVYKDNGTVSIEHGNNAININIESIDSNKNVGIQYAHEFDIDRKYHDYIIFKADLPENIKKISAYLYDSSSASYKFGWGNNDNSIQAGITSGTNIYALKLNEAHIGSGKPDTEVTDGTYNKLELRFTVAESLTEEVITIDWIAFSKYNYGAVMCNGINANSSSVGDKIGPSIINSIVIDEENLILPTAQETYSECQIYESTYNDFENQFAAAEVSYNNDYTDATLVYNIIDKNNYKLLDITVNAKKDSTETTRSYRIKISPKPDPVPTIVINDCAYSSGVLTFSGYVIDSAGEESIPDELLLVMAYSQNEGIGNNGQNLKVWKTTMTDENGEFSDSILIRDDETADQLYDMEVAFCAAGTIQTEHVIYYNNKCIKTLVSDMSTKTDGLFTYMTNGLNKPAFESLGVAFDKYDDYQISEQQIINNNTKVYQSKVNVENVVEIVNGTLLAYSSKKATNDTTLISTLDDFDKNVIKIKLNSDTLPSFSQLDNSRKKTIISHFKSNLKTADYDNWFEFKNTLLESMLLEYITTQRSSAAVKKIILDNKDIILYGKTTDDSDIIAALESETKDSPDDATTYLLNEQKGAIIADSTSLLTKIKEALVATGGIVSEGEGDTIGTGTGTGTGSGTGSGSKDSFVVSGNGKADDTNKDEGKKEDTIINVPEKSSFSDLKNYEWADTAINYLSRKGIVSGTGDGLFEPSRAVTREEFTKLLCESFELQGTEDDIIFTDIPQNAWYKDYVSCAVFNGIINGISENLFGSGKQITREDMAVMICRALKAVNKEINSESVKFFDYDQTSDYAKESVGLLASEGIVNGIGNGNFGPKDVASRAEAAVIIYRCIELSGL